MNNHQKIKALIISYSGRENVITFPKLYLELTKDMNTAALLNQMVFWSDKSKRKDGFFYKSYVEWEDELMLSEYQVRRSVKKLKELGILHTKLKKANGAPTIHYKVDMDQLSESILEKLKNRNLTNLRIDTEETSESLTDDYTDNYTYKNNSRTNVHQVSDKYPPEIETDKSTSGKPSEVVVDKIPYKKIIDYLNERSGKNFRNVEGNKKLIRARWNEGYREDDFYQVIDNMTALWKGKTFSSGEPGENYLRPRTLFQQSKFDEYLNETVNEAEKENASDVFDEVF